METPQDRPVQVRSLISSPEQGTESFTCFPKLPLEIRIMIWTLALPTRIIIINHQEPVPNNIGDVTQRNITEPYPSLLSTCRESRTMTLSTYTSIFPPPALSALKWHLNDKYESRGEYVVASARKIADVLMPDVHDHSAPLKTVVRAVEKYMNLKQNAGQAPQFAAYATRYQKSKNTVTPVFFAPEHDILVLSIAIRFHRYKFLPGLWSQKQGSASAVQRLAIELDIFETPRRMTGVSRRTWTGYRGFYPNAGLSAVRDLWLICTNEYEVIHLTLDNTGSSMVGTWSFTFDLDCTIAKDLITSAGLDFVPVTWHVTLSVPAVSKMTFCELVKKHWKPNNALWETNKRQILMGKIMPQKWWDYRTSSIDWYRTANGKKNGPVEVAGGDGMLWVGSSKGAVL